MISILLVIMLTASLLLCSCSSVTEPTTAIRWTDGESYTFTVTMQPTTIEDAIEFDDNSFVSVTELVDYGALDLVAPTEVSGTYTTLLQQVDQGWLYTTVFAIEEVYCTEATYAFSSFVTSFVDSLTSQQYDNIVVEVADDTVTLQSTTTTTVLFASASTQTPIQSTKTTVGYYIGESNQEYTDIDITCDYEDSTATVSGTINDDTVDTTTTLATGTIDVSQLMLYARSLSQSAEFETSATVYVFDPITATSAYATMDLTQDYYLFLDIQEDGDYDYASVNCIDITIDYAYVAYRVFNNPNDTMSSSIGALNKNTTVMFQSGIYVFQFEDYYSIYDDLAYVTT